MNVVHSLSTHRVVVSIGPTSIRLNLSETLLQRDLSHDLVNDSVVLTAREVSDAVASAPATMLLLAQRVIAVVFVFIHPDSTSVSKVTKAIFMKSFPTGRCGNAGSFLDIRLLFYHLCSFGH